MAQDAARTPPSGWDEDTQVLTWTGPIGRTVHHGSRTDGGRRAINGLRAGRSSGGRCAAPSRRALLHGAQVWPSWANPKVIDAMRGRLWRFGKLSECAFYPYWRANPCLAASNPSVPFSFYESKGRLFVILLNSTAQPQETTLKLAATSRKKHPGGVRGVVYDPAADRETVEGMPQEGMTERVEAYLAKVVEVGR